MAQEEIHVGDIGTIFEITVKDGDDVIDISGATTKTILFKKPGNVKVTQTAAFTTDGTDGKMRYVVVSGDLDTAGQWNIQGKVVLPTGTWNTDIGLFYVNGNL